MTAMYKIAVIGAPDTVVGFKALGLDTFPVSESSEARNILKMLTRPDQQDEYAIIYIEEALAADLETEIARFKDRPSPAVILIPGKNGSLGMGLNALQAAVEKAVGVNIL